MRGECLKRRLDVELVMLGQAFEHAEVKAVAPVPALDGTTGQAQRGEGHHALRVKKRHAAHAVAGRAGAHGRVEGKQARLQLADGIAAHRAREFGVEQVLFPRVHLQRHGAVFGQVQRGFKALGQALAQGVSRLGVFF